MAGKRTTGNRAGKTLRITRDADISRVFEQGRRWNDSLLTLFAIANGLEHSRFGVAVSTRHGNAVQRNRIKRLSREAFRLERPTLPAGWDFMFVPRAGAKFTLERLRESITGLSAKVARV